MTSSAFAASTGSAASARGDELVVYDNTLVAINKAASAAYYYFNGAWRLEGADPTLDQGSTVIPAQSMISAWVGKSATRRTTTCVAPRDATPSRRAR